MINRVTENMKFTTLTGSLFNVQGKAAELMEKISTQKNINRPSDNPIGAGQILNYASTLASIDQYQTNITSAKTWLSLTDTNLEGIKNILAQAGSIATGTTADTMDANASIASSLIDSALSLMNAKSGDSYIFGGSRTDVAPFSATSGVAGIGGAETGASNQFDGTALSGGTYTGTEDKTYKVKIIDGGTVAAATYQISADNGETWGEVQNFPPQIVQGSMANIAGGLPITGATVWNTITGGNVQNGTTIDISGFDHDGNAVGPDTFTITDAATGTVQDLLDQIETTFGGGSEVSATIDSSGRITLTDQATGASSLSMTLSITNPVGGFLNFGAIAASTKASIPLDEGINLTLDDSGTHHLAAGDLFSIPVTIAAPSVSAASASAANKFNGTVASGGTNTATENKTYAVKIIDGGTLTTATYKISTDGGITWGAKQTLPPRTIQGSVANTSGGLSITTATVWNTITGANVQNGTTIDISGVDHDGIAVGPDTFTIADAAAGTVQDLLDQIETTFGGSSKVSAAIDSSGKITLTDKATGASNLSMTLSVTNPAGGNLALGAFTPTAFTSIALGDGVTMNFTAGTQNLAADDLFTVNGYAGGYYRGNDGQLAMQVGKGSSFVYNITGASAFTAANGPVASASVLGAGTGLTADDTITLTRGAAVGSWAITGSALYPHMTITSMSAAQVTIDADNDGTDDIKIALSGQWNTGNTVSFKITAGTKPQVNSIEVHGPGTVDLLKTLKALKTALDNHDLTAVAAQIDDLKNIQTQVLQAQTKVGAKSGSLTNTSERLTSLNEQITSLKSGIEDVDLAKLIVSYQLEQTAMEASYNMAAKIGKMSILDYL